MLFAFAVRLFCAEPLELIARTIPTARMKLTTCFDFDIRDAPDSKFLGPGLQKLAREAARLAHSIGKSTTRLPQDAAAQWYRVQLGLSREKQCDPATNLLGFSKDPRLW